MVAVAGPRAKRRGKTKLNQVAVASLLVVGLALLTIVLVLVVTFPATGGSSSSSNNKEQTEKTAHDVPGWPRADSLRFAYDLAHSISFARIQAKVQESLRLPRQIGIQKAANGQDLPYNVLQCPPEPPQDYPYTWNILQVLGSWNPDNTSIPDKIHQGICYCDWSDPEQQKIAETYRKAELPFLIHNHPEVWQAAERWASPKYLTTLLGKDIEYKTEHSENNHMMYWKMRKNLRNNNNNAYKGWKPPTDITKLNFPEWYDRATQLEQSTQKASAAVDKEHWYFRLNGEFKGPADFLYDELTMFVPEKPGFFMVDPADQRGINCRFGMKGIIAETHFDGSRNFVLIMHGQKRYIIAHPRECPNMMLHPQGHPSARHSSINWSDPADWHKGNFPKAQVNEVVLQAGDALYLPTSWFHFIVSLNLNYQCNARSGITDENRHHIESCGF